MSGLFLSGYGPSCSTNVLLNEFGMSIPLVPLSKEGGSGWGHGWEFQAWHDKS